MVAIAEIKTTAFELYTDTESRPQKVSEFLHSLGADKVLSRVVDETKVEKVLTELCALSTLAGISEKKAQLSDMAAPYIEMAGTTDGRKQLLEETKEFAAPYVTPYVEKVNEKKALLTEKVSEKISAGKEMAAPYISTVKESSAPYVAKLEEIRRSERVEAMLEAFKEAREHPAEKVSELKAKAVDLIKYEKLETYRDYVLSAEFQADTARLVKVELPAVASAAAQRGADSLKSAATALAEEIEGHRAKVKALVAQGYELASAVELDALRVKIASASSTLLKELQNEVTLGVEAYKADGFSVHDVIERLKRVGASVVVEGKALLDTAKTCAKTDTKTGAKAIANGKEVFSDAASEADETFEDATDASPAVPPSAVAAAPAESEA